MKITKYLPLLILVISIAACQPKTQNLVPEIINTYDHDQNAFTQGLLFANDKLYESTGLRGRSSLREVDLNSGEVIRSLSLSDKIFAEGLARVNEKLYQISWQSGKAFVYDLESFNKEKEFSYNTEGWGLCFDGKDLFMSDGSSTLFRRNPKTFEAISKLVVTLNNKKIDYLNELECVDGFIYANIWQTTNIIKIDKKTGKVVSQIDAANLLAKSGATQDPNAVLNGIAYNPDSKTFFLTGKLWPKLFEVRFVNE